MDIVERLRNSDDLSDQQITFACVEAADAIERLHADLRIAGDKFAEVCDENERLRALLDSAPVLVPDNLNPAILAANPELAEYFKRLTAWAADAKSALT